MEDAVIFLGGIFCDLVGVSDRFPQVGETIIGTKSLFGFGGKAANACVMCSRLGAKTAMIGKLGDDANGKKYLENLAKEGVNTKYLYTDPNDHSGVAHIMVEESSGNNKIIVVPGSNATLTPEEVEMAEKMVANAKLMCFGLEGNHRAVIAGLALARKHKIPTLTNAAPAHAELDPKIFELTDILCVNETEAQICIGSEIPIETEENIEHAMGILTKKCPTVIITLGGKGAAVATQTSPKPLWIMAEKTHVVDTTGAGDAFVGALAFYLAYYPHLDLSEAVKRSCSIATVTVQKSGTQTSFPRLDELSKEKFF